MEAFATLLGNRNNMICWKCVVSRQLYTASKIMNRNMTIIKALEIIGIFYTPIYIIKLVHMRINYTV